MCIRLILIEDDREAKAAIRAHLRGRDSFEVIGDVSSREDVVWKIRTLQPDAIIVGIGTLQSAGVAAKRLFSQPWKPIVVFLATHKHSALEAFDLGAADYLLKPICDDRLKIGLKRIQEQFRLRHATERPPTSGLEAQTEQPPNPSESLGRIAIKDRNRTHLIETTEIEWIGAAGDYAELHVRGATHLLRQPISVLLSRLPNHVFCRIHRSFVVNTSRVSGFKTLRNQDLLVRMKDRTILRASRTFSEELKKAIAQECVSAAPSLHPFVAGAQKGEYRAQHV